jgi:hypothetical protein
MKRRDFLRGCAAALAAGATIGVIPWEPRVATPKEIAERWFAQWMRDLQPVLRDHAMNMMTWGIGGLRQIEAYPYIESLSPRDMLPESPTETGRAMERLGAAILSDIEKRARPVAIVSDSEFTAMAAKLAGKPVASRSLRH